MEDHTPDVCVWPRCEEQQVGLYNIPMCIRHAGKLHAKVDLLLSDKKVELGYDHRLAYRPNTPQPPRERSAGYQQRLLGKMPQPLVPGDYVYFIQFRDLIKIGTSSDVTYRLTKLQYETVLGIMPGSFPEEHAIHVRVSHLRDRGEWFRATPEVFELIEEVCIDDPFAEAMNEWRTKRIKRFSMDKKSA